MDILPVLNEIVYFAAGRRSQVLEFIAALPKKLQAAIHGDLETVATMGLRAPVSLKTITGHAPMWEIRNGPYRTFFVVDGGRLWVLGCCKKEEQRRAITLAAERMKTIRGT